MARHAKSQQTKDRELHRRREKFGKRAVKYYQESRQEAVEGPSSASLSPITMDAARLRAERECLDEDKVVIHLSNKTLHRWAQGGRSTQDAHDEQKWLNQDEANSVLHYAIECANRGFPLSHKRLKEHVDDIARARWGDKFPEDGVGKRWTHRFVAEHNDLLATYWSRPLDKSRARAVNATTKKEYFDLLEKVIEGEGGDDVIPSELIYGADESGFQKGLGQKERVIGGRGKKVQHQQRSGDRENITVMVTICGDGSTLPPLVIFKGEAFQASWNQENPENASFGHSKKGYITGEISLPWLQEFDKQTRAKAAGRRRLLLVDGHASHYTRAFLEYARENRIEVIGYPSHSTHIYQGLDVVIFGVCKNNYSDVRDRFEREGGVVQKSNFLKLYAEVHRKTLTEANVKAAFRKTGVIPLDRDVVTEEMMAPSLESSSRAVLPVKQSSPVKHLTEMLGDYVDHQHLAAVSGNENDGDEPIDRPSFPPFIRHAMDSLSASSASFLTSTSPLKSSASPLRFHPYTISPLKPRSRYEELLTRQPGTYHEQLLADALRESEARDSHRKHAMLEMQASAILSEQYARKAQKQLQADEERKQKKKGKRKMGDGKAKFFTGDEFFNLCVEEERRKAVEEVEKVQKQKQNEAWAAELAVWQKKNDAIRKENEPKEEKYRLDMQAWETEQKLAKDEHRRAKWAKPAKKDYKIKALIARPKRKDFVARDGEEAESSSSSGSEAEAD